MGIFPDWQIEQIWIIANGRIIFKDVGKCLVDARKTNAYLSHSNFGLEFWDDFKNFRH
jgi:hypothetical protein